MNRNYCDVETHTVVLFQAVAFPMVGALFLTSLDLWKSSKGRHHRRGSSDCSIAENASREDKDDLVLKNCSPPRSIEVFSMKRLL